MQNIIHTLLPIPIEKPLSYLIEHDTTLSIGSLALVPFRNKHSAAVVWAKPDEESSKDFKLKQVAHVFDLPPLKQSFLQFITQVSNYNMIPLGNVLKAALGAFDEQATTVLNNIKQNQSSEIHHPYHIILSSDQELAAQSIIQTKDYHKVTLLDGVTGSGKTEVYLQSIIEIIENGGQALILLPEIVLTTHLLARFTKILQKYRILQWHSNLTKKIRHQYWLETLLGTAQIVIGARSALFLPFQNLKIIVIDEEHDAGFKQEDGMIYNARDMAILRGSLEKIPVVLSSATPSVETVVNAACEKYNHVILHSRFSGVVMPEIKIIDLNQSKMIKHQWLSDEARSAIIETIKQQKQVLLFLNRRGYAPITMCKKCGTKAQCPQCHFLLVLHRKKQLLQCHYCGYTEDSSSACKICGSAEPTLAYGPGVERIEEELKTFIPDARLLTLTSDTMSGMKKIGNILQSIDNHEIDIIIGTQIVTKGLDFAKLHLVIIIEADSCHMSGDIRSLERTYQLLQQVSGRAGRKSDRGLVLVQTYEPESHLLHHLASGNRDEFIAAEILDRQEANSPPFYRLAIIHLESRNEAEVMKFAHKMHNTAPKTTNIQILGPSPSPISLLRGKYRYRFIIKAPKNINVQKIIKQWTTLNPSSALVSIKIDIDPYNFL